MFRLVRTAEFAAWIDGLRDRRAAARIVERLVRVASGNLGDHKIVDGGVGELRVDYGPGYRVYFLRRGPVLIVLLTGGDKRSQSRDIKRAMKLAEEFR